LCCAKQKHKAGAKQLVKYEQLVNNAQTALFILREAGCEV